MSDQTTLDAKWFWWGLPPEVWLEIITKMTLPESARFSLICRAAHDIFISSPHWRMRVERLGRTMGPGDPRASFRAAINGSFVLWMDKSRVTAVIRGGHLGCPVGEGLFPILQMGPLGYTYSHAFTLGCIRAVSRMESCGLERPGEVQMTDTVTPKHLIRAMLVVGNQLNIQVKKMRYFTGELGRIQFMGQDSISINSATWNEFMGVFRETCKTIDRTVGWIVTATQ